MFCYLCGKELPDGARFCPACGAKAAAPTAKPAPPQPTAESIAPPSQPSATPPTPPVHSSPFRFWKLAAGLFCVVALVLVLVFRLSVGQALLAAKAGATYVSPFVGRLDDISEDGVELVAHIVRVYRTYGFKTQVLAASIRHTRHIIQCLDAGADVATCPLAAIKGLLKHPLTESGLAQFLADHARVNG